VVLKEVPLSSDLLGLLADQGILRVRDDALVVLPNGDCSGDWGIEDLPHKLMEVESLLGGICRILAFSRTCGMDDTRLLLGLVVDMTAVGCKQVART
jgi:hypothetical protein